MSRFFVLMGETSVERVEPAPDAADVFSLRAWAVADVARPGSYWGHDERGMPLPEAELRDSVTHPDGCEPGVDWNVGDERGQWGGITVVVAASWPHEPAVWCVVEAADEAAIRAAWPDVW